MLDRHGVPGARLAFTPTPGVARLAARVSTAPLTTLTPDDVPGFLAPSPSRRLLSTPTPLTACTWLACTPSARSPPSPGARSATTSARSVPPSRPWRAARTGVPCRARPALVLRARRELDWPLVDRAMLAALVGRLLAPTSPSSPARVSASAAPSASAAGDRTIRAVARLPRPPPPPRRCSPPSWPPPIGHSHRRAARTTRTIGPTPPATPASPPSISPSSPPVPRRARQASFFDVPQGRLGQLHTGLAEARRRGDSPIGFLRPVAADHPAANHRYSPIPRHCHRPARPRRDPPHLRPRPARRVWCEPRTGTPCRLRWRGRTALIATVEASWSWSEGWWREGGATARRRYHRLVTRDGLRCVSCRDLATGRWHLEAILD
ncbi:MAG: hypothetical protein U0841_21860 [Chloroflexia bacterium]